MQRRPSVTIFAENQLGMLFEQRLDLCQVPGFCRVVNFIAEGDAAPGQRKQQNGGKAKNCRTASGEEKGGLFIVITLIDTEEQSKRFYRLKFLMPR
jgi:hypothetical protein